ncbi:hypothetical protein ABGB17_26475 [Sphaerisporangium sp. B11E5]|uniref:hypothetical protein n=1 Tax=Sphaerisporangium sp. B11E5 TaxID=3153563 RepID=UPI00325C89F3
MTPAGASPPHGRNPFPLVAVEMLSPHAPLRLSVTTPACDTVLDNADAFLRSLAPDGRAFPGAGNVLAVVGENGTGKTHLAMVLCHRLLEGGPAVRPVCVDRVGNSFLEVYRQFAGQVDRWALSGCVQRFYAGVVADSLAGSPAAADIVAGLREGRLSPQGVVRRYGLMRTGLLEELRVRLTAATGDPVHGTAFALIQRPEFTDLVWDWLRGGPPAAALVDRGVAHAVDTEAAAVEALRALTMVFAAQERPFALFVDEFDGLLAGPPESVPGKAHALGRLMEAYISTGSLLVLTGRPAAFRLLPAQVAERLGAVVRPSAFTARHAEEYLRMAFGGLGPFTGPGVGHLVEMTGGNPRWFIRLCHRAYERAVRRDEPVTPAMVQHLIGEDGPASGGPPFDRRREGASASDALGDVRRQQALISVLTARVEELAARVERLEGGGDAVPPGMARGHRRPGGPGP